MKETETHNEMHNYLKKNQSACDLNHQYLFVVLQIESQFHLNLFTTICSPIHLNIPGRRSTAQMFHQNVSFIFHVRSSSLRYVSDNEKTWTDNLRRVSIYWLSLNIYWKHRLQLSSNTNANEFQTKVKQCINKNDLNMVEIPHDVNC